MNYKIAPLERLVEQFESLPGIGHKSAGRLAFHVLRQSPEKTAAFVDAILAAKEKIHECTVCCNLTDRALCPVCEDPTRDKSVICVVEDARDVAAFERTREYKGLYHVLGGTISPMAGINPEDIHIKELLVRLTDEHVKEVIMATNPTVEGEATAMYIARLIKAFPIKVTRLAYGIPVGGDVEYADEVTLRRSLEGRGTL